LSGLPGSGKDTYIKNNLKNLPIISLDEIRKELNIKPTKEQGKVIQKAKEKAKEYLRKGEDFIWNATNTSKQMRTSLIQLFDIYNAYMNIIFIYKPLNDILIQNKQRNDIVPNDIIKKLFRKMEIPLSSECHKVDYFI
jgi:predicted kinase